MVTNFGNPGLLELQARGLEDQGMPLGMPYAALCLTSLPRREVPMDQPWVRHFPNSTLSLEPGTMYIHGEQRPSKRFVYGLPFGARARILMLYFWREVTRTGHRELERAMSYRKYLEYLDIPPGGKSYRSLRDQAWRIFGCRMILAFRYGRVSGVFEDCLFEGGTIVRGEEGSRLRYNTMLLGSRLFESMRDNPMPMLDSAIRQISNQSFALDVYCWLSSTLPRIEDELTFSWIALRDFFGPNYSELRHFRGRMAEALERVCGLYPEARVHLDDHDGVILRRSPAPCEETTQPLARPHRAAMLAAATG